MLTVTSHLLTVLTFPLALWPICTPTCTGCASVCFCTCWMPTWMYRCQSPSTCMLRAWVLSRGTCTLEAHACCTHTHAHWKDARGHTC
ncbi:hypothetical protein DFH94DRAFT_425683 [Russula ochroleuca]|uniref:Secreted protein n=1 Tax=Russula ochroleuca TaxID=152965 RepID=A0A9P5JVB2_9AGAM|nr:hypothetical protein DFH94DRAFT_425683 [Russula ochroleuca]